MRKVLLAVMMASTMVAVPASAQTWRLKPVVQKQIQSDINQLGNNIQRAQQRRTISQREAVSLRKQALNVQRTYNRYARNGLDRREVADLEVQVNRLRQQLRLERRDWDGRRG